MTDAGRLPARVRFTDSVQPRFGPDRGFLFDQGSGRVYSLNATGAFAAARIQEQLPVAALVAALVEAFDVDAATAGRELAKFVGHLLEEGLAEAVEAPDA
jgi:hypothetical protein